VDGLTPVGPGKTKKVFLLDSAKGEGKRTGSGGTQIWGEQGGGRHQGGVVSANARKGNRRTEKLIF